jgi:hypothetical protein
MLIEGDGLPARRQPIKFSTLAKFDAQHLLPAQSFYALKWNQNLAAG